MAIAASMTIGVPGVVIAINYLTSNNKITNIDWEMAPGYAGRVQIWDNETLVYDQVYGTGTGSEKVPGNHTMVEKEDEFGGPNYMAIPDYLTYALHIRTIG